MDFFPLLSNRCGKLKVLRASQRAEGLKEPPESFMVATERKKQETQKISNQKNLHRELSRSCVATHRRGGGEFLNTVKLECQVVCFTPE